ncbi:MAG: hypothetical protein JXA94_04885 [Parachlamydiales bacterium]|nr:hypothetical protein [Parachlamydiales bacterium]
MAFFKNFIIAVIIIGICSRVAKYFFLKKFDNDVSVFLSTLTTAIIILPLISIFVGFDIAISEYLIGVLIWLLFDLMRLNINRKEKK